jgi:hypothetical protein
MMLFEPKSRTSMEWCQPGEDSYAFLDRTGRKQFEETRARLNKWFSNYPDSNKALLKTRFIKDDFNTAFFELYVHQKFLDQDFVVDAQVEDLKTGYTPDFLVKKGEEVFYVEATTSREAIEKMRYEHRCSIIKERLNRIEQDEFWLNIKELKLLTNSSFKTTILEKKLLAHINKYSRITAHTSIPDFLFSDEKIEVVIGLMKIDEVPIGPYERIGLDSSFDKIWGDNSNSIRKTILKKAKKYSRLSHPLIICLNVQSRTGMHKEDVEAALYGDLYLKYSKKDPQKSNWARKNNGLLTKRNMSKVKNIVKIIITSVTAWHEGNEEVYEFNIKSSA